jgi:hypothetical protein
MKIYHLKSETHNVFVGHILETEKFYLVPDKDGLFYDFFSKEVYGLTVLEASEPKCEEVGFQNIP